jgi:hypothetical protein
MKCVYIIQTGRKRGQANGTHFINGTFGEKSSFESIAQKVRGKPSDAGIVQDRTACQPST